MAVEEGTFIVRDDANAEYVKSGHQRFRFRWPVADAYEVRDGILGPKLSAEWHFYYPAAHENLPLKLASIEEGDEDALLTFTHRYGMLGLRNLLPSIPFFFWFKRSGVNVSSWELREFIDSIEDDDHRSLDEDEIKKARKEAKRQNREDSEMFAKYGRYAGLLDRRSQLAWSASNGGDPLPWIWAHIRTLRLCRDLTDLIARKDTQAAEQFISQHQVEQLSGAAARDIRLPVAFQHRILNVTYSVHAEVTGEAFRPIEFLKRIRRELINNNTQGISTAIEPVSKREEIFFEFRSLVEIIYWHLRTSLLGSRLRRCKECGSFFVQGDKREIFCPVPKKYGQSVCGNRFRSRMAMRKSRREKGKAKAAKKR